MLFTKILTLMAACISLTCALPMLPVRRSTNGTYTGSITIVNHLSQPLYLWSVAETEGAMNTLQSSGGSYSESWRLNTDGGGVSIKISDTQSSADVLQYEYTLETPTIWWDLSCINIGSGSIFTKAGFQVISSNNDCVSAVCAPGDEECAAAYLSPTDNQATHSCASSTQMTLHIGGS